MFSSFLRCMTVFPGLCCFDWYLNQRSVIMMTTIANSRRIVISTQPIAIYWISTWSWEGGKSAGAISIDICGPFIISPIEDWATHWLHIADNQSNRLSTHYKPSGLCTVEFLIKSDIASQLCVEAWHRSYHVSYTVMIRGVTSFIIGTVLLSRFFYSW